MTSEYIHTPHPETGPRRLGTVIGGAHSSGVEVKVDVNSSIEDIRVGSHVTIRSTSTRFFGMITDVSLKSTDPSLASQTQHGSNQLVIEILAGTTAYGVFKVRPRLVLPNVLGDNSEVLSRVRSVPVHFSPVIEASEADYATVFGQEDGRHFWIGSPLDIETKICLDMNTFVQRSNGVFGKSGTGKSFLTRLLLAGIIQKTDAVSLIFDMHNDHGWQGRDRERGLMPKGLKQLFDSRVAIFTLDARSSLARGVRFESEIQIRYADIEPEDIELLASTLNLTELGIQALYRLSRHLGRQWLEKFLEFRNADDLTTLADELKESTSTLSALRRRLERLERMPYLTKDSPADPLGSILDLLQRGTHIVLEFGNHRSLADYILVSNLLTRRIREKYIQLTQRASTTNQSEPRPLVICIEEAHAFLDSSIGAETTFGAIAREDRKNNITLMVVDQRPSSLDPDVISQIGTRIVYPLDNDRDIASALSGAPDSGELRAVLAGLDAQQQALVFGYAVPTPIVVKVREYGSNESYRQLQDSAVYPASSSYDEKGRDLLFP